VVKHADLDRLVAFIEPPPYMAQEISYCGQSVEIAAFRPSSESVLRVFCSKRLPPIMVPSRWVVVRSFTQVTSTNGKLDRRTLGQIDLSILASAADGGHADEQLTNVEKTIAKVWAERLGIGAGSIAASDSFLHVGGDSLDAQKVSQTLIKLVSDHQGAGRFLATAMNFGELDAGLEPVHLLSAKSLRAYAQHLMGTEFGPLLASISAPNSSGSCTDRNNDARSSPSQDPAGEQDLAGEVRALYMCTSDDNVPGLQVLLDPRYMGISPDAGISRAKRAKSPLHVAAANGHSAAIQVLLQYGANVFVTNADKVPPVHVAASFPGSSASTMLAALIAEMKKRVKSPTIVRDGRRQTLLHACARGGNVQAMQLLLSDLNSNFAQDETSRLNFVNCIDRWNRTPLHWAILNDHYDAAQTLLEAGAKVRPGLKLSQQTKSTHLPYELPLELAQRRGRARILELLQQYDR
jgi:hypothetical protein